MKKRIYSEVDKNKGSCRDLSCIFKIVSIIVLLIFILSPKEVSENKIWENNNDNIFLMPYVVSNESSETSIFQKNTIYAYSPLYIPETQVFGVQSEKLQCREDIMSYKVQQGENLSFIASKFNISVDTIAWANNLKNNTINPGQDLVILPVSGVFHITKSGETVSGIAKKYGAKEQDIFDCNGIEEIMIGDILIIPGGKIPEISRKPAPRPLLSSSSWLTPPASGYISQRLHHHNAIDIANERCLTSVVPVYASASGTVQKTGYHGTAGHYVRILHSNGIVTFYGHLFEIWVSVGQSVSQGAAIGRMGNTGYTIGRTGCHVHFEVRGGTNPFGSYPLNHRF